MSSTIHILIADNSYLVRAGLKALLADNSDFVFLGEVSDSLELGEKLIFCQPTLLIIDSNSENFSTENIKVLLNKYKNIKVLSVCSYQDKFSVARSVDIGIHSFLLKDCDKDEITEAIYKTAEGNKFMCGKIVATITGENSNETSCEGFNITEREIEIIKLLAEGNSNKQIADILFLSTHTVNTHRKNIMAKVGVNNAAGLVFFAVKENLISPNKYLFSSPN